MKVYRIDRLLFFLLLTIITLERWDIVDKLNELYKYLGKINDLSYIISLLDWELKMNVPNDVISDVNRLIRIKDIKLFRMKTDKKYGELLESIIKDKSFKTIGDIECHHILKLYKDYNNYKNVPLKFYKKHMDISISAGITFEDAKKKNDASIVLPKLEAMIESTKKLYSYRGSKKNIYDLMLDDFEEGMTTKEIDKLFNEIKDSLIPLIKKINIKKLDKIKYNFSSKELKDSALVLLSYIGFDFDKGDVNIYQNAFTARLGFNDVRITFNNNDNPATYASTVIHEGGHGLVEANISPEYIKYASTSLKSLTALHESQSRFYENILGRNKNFWIPIYEDFKNKIGINLSLDEFVEYITLIKPGAIRLEADELTYCMHIIVRYEIEKDLFNGKISVYDIEKEWNKKMYEYLGVEVKNDSEGFLQDVHWAQGYFGYFPSYLLGTIYDGMIREAIEKDLGSIDDLLKNNKIKEITNYLKDNIYKYGGAYSSKEIINKMCGSEISTKPIINYFKRKYGSNN